MILILGVTASGKGRLAFDLAEKIGAEIISIDSMKVYKRMDIGTAKTPIERQKRIKHHMIDIVEPSEAFSVDQFLQHCRAAIDQIKSAGKPVVAVGGTALYIKTLLYGLFEGPPANEDVRTALKAQIDDIGLPNMHKRLAEVDPEAGQRIHPNDQRRIVRALEVYQLTGKPISSFQQQFAAEKMLDDWTIIGLTREKDIESNRMNMRIKKMVEMGLVEEVRSLLAEEKPLSKQAAAAIGYAEIIAHFNGEIPLEDAIENIKINTRRFAKSQRTWFKTFKNVNWIDVAQDESPENVLARAMTIIGA